MKESWLLIRNRMKRIENGKILMVTFRKLIVADNDHWLADGGIRRCENNLGGYKKSPSGLWLKSGFSCYSYEKAYWEGNESG